jgi:hypothetical protein
MTWAYPREYIRDLPCSLEALAPKKKDEGEREYFPGIVPWLLSLHTYVH